MRPGYAGQGGRGGGPPRGNSLGDHVTGTVTAALPPDGCDRSVAR